MLDSLVMLLAYFVGETLFVFIVKVETCLCKYRVLGDNLIEDVNVERESLGSFQLFDQFTADWTTHTVLMVKLLDAVSTESVATVDQDARDSLSDIVL